MLVIAASPSSPAEPPMSGAPVRSVNSRAHRAAHPLLSLAADAAGCSSAVTRLDAAAWVSSEIEPQRLYEMVRDLHEGGLITCDADESNDSPAVRLTPRAEILRCVANGSANDVIATQLDISVHTVRTHMHNVMSKLSVRSRAAAVDEARAQFLLGPPDSDW